MISTKLPGIETFGNKPPDLKDNMVLLANSQTKYYYPEHKTPYLFIANFIGTGRYVANQRKIEVSDKYFYFLNDNNNLEIDFKENTSFKHCLFYLSLNLSVTASVICYNRTSNS